jgi:hypothetical protein
MGYELAPYNKLFAGGKNRSLNGMGLEFAKPASADFDLGDGSIDSNMSSADINLADTDDEAFMDNLDLDLESGESGELSEDGLANDEARPAPAATEALAADQLVAEILAESTDEDPTNLNFGNDRTSYLNFEQDAPVLMEQYENDARDLHEDGVKDLDRMFDDRVYDEDKPLDPGQFDDDVLYPGDDASPDLNEIDEIAEDDAD